MTVNLTQSEAAAFPDRGRTGLLVSLLPGPGGAYLSVELQDDLPAWHARWTMRDAGLAGGSAVVFACFDDGGAEVCRVTFDPALSRITALLATGQDLVADLPPHLAWHCVEVAVDTAAGGAALWINGVQRAATVGDYTALAARTFWLGAPLKDADLAGDLHLDEWVIADDDVGSVRVAADSPFADDPARWLVIYNTADDDAAAWAEHYRAARRVPCANLLGLPLPLNETIDAAQFASLHEAVELYLAQTGLDAQVMGLLVGYRVPGYVEFEPGVRCAIDDLLHLASDQPGVAFNPGAIDALPARCTHSTLTPHRLTARLDAPNLAAALALVDRASAVIATDLGAGLDAVLHLDPFAGGGPFLAAVTQGMVDWSQSVDRQRLRLPLRLSGPLDSTTPQQFDTIADDGFFWGWGQTSPPAGFFADPPGRRMVCAQLTVSSATATTARDEPANWIGAPLAAGYAVAIASCAAMSPSNVPLVRPFFGALRRGWTLAEAWYAAKPVLRDGFQLIGDPLMRVPLPCAGWDVFGPLTSLEQLDPAQPAAALRRDETALALSPVNGLFVVRAVDAAGQSEAGLALASVMDVSGAAARHAVRPVWPAHDGWPVRIRDGAAVLTLAWDRTIRAARVDRIELRGEWDGGAEAVLAVLTPSPAARWLRHVVAMPAVSARFRWCITSATGAAWLSPWSMEVTPREPLAAPLQVLEVQP